MLSVGKALRQVGVTNARKPLFPVFVVATCIFCLGYLLGGRRVLYNRVTYRAPSSRGITVNGRQQTPNLPQANRSTDILKEPLPGPNLTHPQKTVITSPSRRTLPYEFVVAHYNESLDWFKPYAKEAGHVYHKGPDSGPPFQMYKWEKLTNLGRECQTYLHHIIHNYDNLADVTVFLLGHGPIPDKTWCFHDPMEFLEKAKQGKFCKVSGKYSIWGRIRHHHRWLEALKAGTMRRANMTVGEFYKALFGTNHPVSVPMCLAACFSATRENLRLHPISFYQKAIRFVNFHVDHEEAHYFERLWSKIINAH